MNSRKIGIAIPLLVCMLIITVVGGVSRVSNAFEVSRSVAYPEDEERKLAPTATGVNGEILEVVEIQEVLGHTVIVYIEPTQGQYYYLDIPGETVETAALFKSWPSQVREITIKSANENYGLLRVKLGKSQSVKSVSYWNGNDWLSLAEAKSSNSTSTTVVGQPRPLPPFKVVPGNPPNYPCSGGWVYQYSYWTAGGCLWDVYKCANSMNVITTLACCFKGAPGQGGPDCESFGLN
jgi:hypothetical protein